MIDINYHLLIEAGKPPPADYHESFVKLTRLGVLPREFAAQIAACAGLRNRIAHEYDARSSEGLTRRHTRPCATSFSTSGT